jgi:hypothetical protein
MIGLWKIFRDVTITTSPLKRTLLSLRRIPKKAVQSPTLPTTELPELGLHEKPASNDCQIQLEQVETDSH